MFLSSPFLFSIPCCTLALAQSAPGDPRELPADVLAALEASHDFTFNFDQPGFYAVVEHVKRATRTPGYGQTAVNVDDWRVLVERPSDFRGAVVTVTGVVGRNKSPYVLQRRPDLGEITQLELLSDTQPLACTVICTEDVADLPVDAEVEVTGYFVLVRNYKGPGARVQQSAVIVTPAPTSFARVRRSPLRQFDWRWMSAAVIGAGVVVWLVVRRAASGEPTDVHVLSARGSAPESLADELASWASEQPGGDPTPGSPPVSAGRTDQSLERTDEAGKASRRT